jgi:hypothetical protein
MVVVVVVVDDEKKDFFMACNPHKLPYYNAHPKKAAILWLQATLIQ